MDVKRIRADKRRVMRNIALDTRTGLYRLTVVMMRQSNEKKRMRKEQLRRKHNSKTGLLRAGHNRSVGTSSLGG